MERSRYVLMLDTDPDDRDLTESTLIEIGNTVPVHFAASLAALHAMTVAIGTPAIILVNDHGAAHSGSASLQGIRQHPDLAGIPVIVLGEVSSAEYIRACYLAGANSFIVKPSSVQATREKISSFFRYWFDTATI